MPHIDGFVQPALGAGSPPHESPQPPSDSPPESALLHRAVEKLHQEPDLPIGQVTGFPLPPTSDIHLADITDYGSLNRTLDAFVDSTRAIDLGHMLSLMKQMDDRRWNAEIALLTHLDQLGAVTMINPRARSGEIVVTLPPCFEEARAEMARRASRKDEVAKVWSMMPPRPTYVDRSMFEQQWQPNPENPCAEMKV